MNSLPAQPAQDLMSPIQGPTSNSAFTRPVLQSVDCL